MAIITIKSYGGISPKAPPRYLPENMAQTALNCDLNNTSLKPQAGLGAPLITLPKVGTPKTIYRFGQDLISDTQYWFHWTIDVDVCRSQLTGDTSEWTFFTGDGVPKATYAAIATTGVDYPAASRTLGIPAPTTALTATLGAFTPGPSDISETRVYAWTWVNKEAGFEFESAPSPASASVDVYAGQSVTLSGRAAVPGGLIVTHWRLYRSVSGTYLFVAEIPVANSSYVDNVLAEGLGEELPSLTWLPPPDNLKGLINLPNGVMAGFVGRDIYFCDPYHPHAWPRQYVQSVDFPVVGLGRMDTTLAVLTTGTPYFIQGSSPDSAVVVKSDLEQACSSKESIVSTNGAVLYASPDGLVMLSSNGSKMVTDQYFTRAQWQSQFKPESIHAYAHELKYYGFYDTGTVQGGFVYDFLSGQFTVHDVYATAGYTDLLRDKLFLAFADRTIKAWGVGSAKTYTWKSKKFTQPQTTAFSCAQVEAETYPLTAKFYAGGTLVHTQTVTSRDVFRLPASTNRDWEVQLEGTSEVFSVSLATSVQELTNV